MPDGDEPKPDIYVDELKEKLAAHLQWRQSGGLQGERLKLHRADLRGAQLEGADLSLAQLEGADFSNVHLEGADLSKAQLEEANFSNAHLEGADLSKAELEGADFSNAHLERVKLSLAHLETANFLDAKLEGVILFKAHLAGAGLNLANLQGVDLRRAHLEGANLRRAHLEGADLYGAHLEGALLKETHLEGADCYLTRFDDADLRNAIFEGQVEEEVSAQASTETNPEPPESRGKQEKKTKFLTAKNLSASQLARADLHQAVLPSHGVDFEPGLERAKVVSTSARGVFLSLIGACVFSWLALANTTDLALLLNDEAFYLPIVNIKVAANGFFLAAPAILLSFYVYLHLYLRKLWQACSRLPARFPDGDTLEQRITPWLVSALVTWMPRMPKDQKFFQGLQMTIGLLTAWGLVPLTMFWYWLRYLPAHDIWISTLQGTMTLVACALGVAFLIDAHQHLTGTPWLGSTRAKSEAKPRTFFSKLVDWWEQKIGRSPRIGPIWLGKDCQSWPWPKTRPTLYSLAALAALFALSFVLSEDVIRGVPSPDYLHREGYLRGAALEELKTGKPDPKAKDKTVLMGDYRLLRVPEVLHQRQQETWLNGWVSQGFLVLPGINWACAHGYLDVEEENVAPLPEKDFTTEEVPFPTRLEVETSQKKIYRHWVEWRANYRKQLKAWARRLSRRNLSEKQLEFAQMEGAFLVKADLRGANLTGANLVLADLRLVKASSTEGGVPTCFRFAKLTQAKLGGADLRKAHLEGVDLRGAQLEGANLFFAHLEGGYLGRADLEGADLRYAHLKGADLRKAHLEGADLRRAHFEGADLTGADLEGANLESADMKGANLREAHLEGADLTGTHLEGVNLSGAFLTKEQFDSAENTNVKSLRFVKSPIPAWLRFAWQAEDKLVEN